MLDEDELKRIGIKQNPKRDGQYCVLRIGDCTTIERIKYVLPKNRLSPPMSKEEAQLFKKLFK